MTSPAIHLNLQDSDLSFLQAEAQRENTSVEEVIKSAVSLYRQRATEVDAEADGCCGGGCGGCHCGN